VYNNPVRHTDPSGHCPPGDDDCWAYEWIKAHKYNSGIGGGGNKLKSEMETVTSLEGKTDDSPVIVQGRLDFDSTFQAQLAIGSLAIENGACWGGECAGVGGNTGLAVRQLVSPLTGQQRIEPDNWAKENGWFGNDRTIPPEDPKKSCCPDGLHPGIDSNSNSENAGDPIYGAMEGRVVSTGTIDSFGNYVVIEHNKQGITFFSVYAHLSEIEDGIEENAWLSTGEKIGEMGQSGGQETVHLHFEVRLENNIDLDATHPFSGEIDFWAVDTADLYSRWANLNLLFPEN